MERGFLLGLFGVEEDPKVTSVLEPFDGPSLVATSAGDCSESSGLFGILRIKLARFEERCASRVFCRLFLKIAGFLRAERVWWKYRGFSGEDIEGAK